MDLWVLLCLFRSGFRELLNTSFGGNYALPIPPRSFGHTLEFCYCIHLLPEIRCHLECSLSDFASENLVRLTAGLKIGLKM